MTKKKKNKNQETWGDWASRKASEVYNSIPDINPIKGVKGSSVGSILEPEKKRRNLAKENELNEDKGNIKQAKEKINDLKNQQKVLIKSIVKKKIALDDAKRIHQKNFVPILNYNISGKIIQIISSVAFTEKGEETVFTFSKDNIISIYAEDPIEYDKRTIINLTLLTI